MTIPTEVQETAKQDVEALIDRLERMADRRPRPRHSGARGGGEVKRLIEWIERNAGPIENWIGIAFFVILWVMAASITTARLMGYFDATVSP